MTKHKPVTCQVLCKAGIGDERLVRYNADIRRRTVRDGAIHRTAPFSDTSLLTCDAPADDGASYDWRGWGHLLQFLRTSAPDLRHAEGHSTDIRAKGHEYTFRMSQINMFYVPYPRRDFTAELRDFAY
jgi:hypothetical protein